MISAVEKELNSYIHRLNAAEKKSLLSLVKTRFPHIEAEEAYTIEQYNIELDDADAAMERGESYANDEVFETVKEMTNAYKKSKLV